MSEIKIGDRLIGANHPPVVIAEIGINHEGSLDLAIEMADAAINAGAEIVKHQTHVIDDEMSDEARSVIPGNATESIYEIMSRCALSEDDEYILMRHVISKGSIFLSTPFSRAAADRLNRFGVPAFKIGSGECSNYPLIRHIAKYRKPMIVSTGMNSVESVKPTVDIMEEYGVQYALLHCTNIYPTPHNLVRLNAMIELQQAFPRAVVGLSDHTVDNYSCLGAVALGGSILERHFTDKKTRSGPDISCSMDPEDLSELIDGSYKIYLAKSGHKRPLLEETPTIAFAFASVVAIKDLAVGDTLTTENIWLKRPGGGDFGPSNYDELIGRKLVLPIRNGQRLTAEHIKE